MDLDKLLADDTEVEEATSEAVETVETPAADVEKAVPAETKKQTKPKKKGKPRGGNSPVIGDNGMMLQEGDNAKFLSVQMALFEMPNIDMENVEEVQKRLSEYFALYALQDMKPTVAGMAIALNGMSRRTLWAIVNDAPTGSSGYKTALPSEVARTIKKAYFLLENLWESYMNSGKVNPVAGIFLGKNNYGYQDKTEYVLTPNTNQDDNYSADDIRQRYIAAEQKRLSTINSADEEPTE